MLDKFIESLSDEQKQALIDSLSDQLTDREPTENPENKSPRELMNEHNDSLKKEPVRNVDLDFTVSKEVSREKTKVPVTETKRFNSFTDDGTEAQGSEFKTPDIQPTQRRRPPVNKVSQKCTKCDKTVKVHPTHARDWFICDRCIGAR